MKSLKLDILLENLKFECKYHTKDGAETFCERAWGDTEKGVLRHVNCGGSILKCELTKGSILRRVA